MKRGFLIFNPSAGVRRKSHAAISGILREFQIYGIDMVPSPTEPDGNLVQQTRRLVTHSPDLIVVWGGDGTINEVVNGMFGAKVPIGVLSGGTANLLAREVGIPSQISEAIRVIASGNTRAISVGQANQRYFLLMVGIGFDSEVIKNVDWSLKKKIGKLAFGISAVNTARKYDFPVFAISVDGEKREGVFAVICNARQYAAYFVLVPDADISDDYFYVCLFKERGILNMSRYFVRALSGTHLRLQSVEVLKGTRVEVQGSENIAVQADGELIGYLPIQFQIHPRSLHVFCP